MIWLWVSWFLLLLGSVQYWVLYLILYFSYCILQFWTLVWFFLRFSISLYFLFCSSWFFLLNGLSVFSYNFLSIFIIIISNSFSGNSCTFIPLRPITGHLLCSFDGVTFPWFFMIFVALVLGQEDRIRGSAVQPHHWQNWSLFCSDTWTCRYNI